MVALYWILVSLFLMDVIAKALRLSGELPLVLSKKHIVYGLIAHVILLLAIVAIWR